MARDAASLIDALGLEQVDLFGFSMGGYVAQQIAVDRPELVRRLILVGTGPRGGEGMGQLAPDVAPLFGTVYDPQDLMWLPIFFSPSEESQAAGRRFLERIRARTEDRDVPVSRGHGRRSFGGRRASGERRPRAASTTSRAIPHPTLVVNGSNDIVVPTVNSYILQQNLPNAELILFPDSNHGSHFQFTELFNRVPDRLRRSRSRHSDPRRVTRMFDHVTLRVADLADATDCLCGCARCTRDRADHEHAEPLGLGELRSHADRRAASDRSTRPRRVRRADASPRRTVRSGRHRRGVCRRRARRPSPEYADDYYTAFLKDRAGNSFEAVHRDGERPRGNIDHVAIRVNDVEASTAFYSTIGPQPDSRSGQQTSDRAVFAVGASDGSFLVIAGEPTRNIHIAFSGEDDDVRRFHADATAAGYRSNGEPGERPRYHDGYYAAYVLDPDGNNIEVVNHHR